MNLSDRDIVLLCLFVGDVVKSHTFSFQIPLKNEYRLQVQDLYNRLIIEREKQFKKIKEDNQK